ncbi:MAG: hypothetical protein GEV03_10670 [Streptosporangiales bacterium]|nr:hypothetical protein [Streptosporangiales bacterium]
MKAPVITSQPEVAPPRSFWEYVKSIGPGFVVAMSWLGAGDFIDSSVSGVNYGYALMWALVLALFCRYFFVSAIAKYYLCNAKGDVSIFTGFGRLWRGLPGILGIAAFISGFILQTYMSVGIGTALYHLSGGIGGPTWGVFIWTAVGVVLTALLLIGRRSYSFLEIVARVTVAVLVVTFVTTALWLRPDVPEVAKGLVFDTPANQGLFTSLLVAAALIGAVGGSAGNLTYPEFMADKGWRGPRFRRVQLVDLGVGIAAIIVVDLAVWIVGAEVARANDLTISAPEDLATMMRLALGQVGPTLMWVGLFFVTFSSFPAYARGYTKVLFSGLYETFGRRARRYGTGESDPLFNWLQIGIMVLLPLVFALPAFPDVVVLTVAGSSTSAILAPVIMGGVLILTNRKSLMLPGYTNRWWENAILFAVAVIGVWASWHVIKGLIDLAAKVVGG